jgi:hypothetical protein
LSEVGAGTLGLLIDRETLYDETGQCGALRKVWVASSVDEARVGIQCVAAMLNSQLDEEQLPIVFIQQPDNQPPFLWLQNVKLNEVWESDDGQYVVVLMPLDEVKE